MSSSKQIERTSVNYVWTTKTGEQILIPDMSTGHIVFALRMMQKRRLSHLLVNSTNNDDDDDETPNDYTMQIYIDAFKNELRYRDVNYEIDLYTYPSNRRDK